MDLNERLAPNFTLREFLVSGTADRHGIKNTPTPVHLINLKQTALIMQFIRDNVLSRNPVIITSAYRNPEVNRLVGGSSTSDHSNGLAADFRSPTFGNPFQIALAINAHTEVMQLIDQLILEYATGFNDLSRAWVHCGFGARKRQQLMTKLPNGQFTTGIRLV